jgi:adenylate cyclase
LSDDKGVGIKGWLKGPRSKDMKAEIPSDKLLPIDEHRIAVLPMANISPDPKDAYFAEGMTEELITVLSQVQGLRVIARTSIDRYSKRDKSVAEIARELQVGSVMEGGVRMAGDRIRVTVQLISGKSEEHLWSEKYDRKLDDIFGIQTDIAKQVAKSLKVKLLHGEEDRIESRAPLNSSVYSAYLKGRTLLASRSEPELKAARELFESAIAIDPGYAPAYSGLADSYILLGDYTTSLPPSTANMKARELVSKALEINPDLAEARATLGLLLASDYDFASAEKELRRAISLNPSYSNAHNWLGQFVMASQGRYRECLEELNMAELADPMSIAVLYNEYLWLTLYAGNEEQAVEKVAKANRIYPEHTTTRQLNMLLQYHAGNYSQAIRLAMEAEGAELTLRASDHVIFPIAAFWAIGNLEEARKWLAKVETLPQETPFRPGWIALAHAALGEVDEFFFWAHRACEESPSFNWGRLRLIDKELPAMRNIHDDPRFTELFKQAQLKA